MSQGSGHLKYLEHILIWKNIKDVRDIKDIRDIKLISDIKFTILGTPRISGRLRKPCILGIPRKPIYIATQLLDDEIDFCDIYF